MAPKRKSERALVSIVARYRSPLIFDYVDERCCDLSLGGMFIKSNNPVTPGTLLKLECLVDNGPDKIQGVARVVWVRRVDSPEGPRGMGVKFVKLEPGSQELIERIIENAGTFQHEQAQVSFQDESEDSASLRSKQQTQETAEAEPEQTEGFQREHTDEGLQDNPPLVEENATVTPSPTSEQKAVLFPRWAMIICAIALAGLVFVWLYDDDKSVKPAEPEDLTQAKETKHSSSSRQVRRSAKRATNSAGRQNRVAAANQISEPDPVEENNTPIERNLSGKPLRSESTTNGPVRTDLKYVLKVTTSPTGAKVSANHHSIVSPGTLELGVVSSPIRVTAVKTNYHSTRVIVEQSIFVQKENVMEGRVHLDLKKKPQKPETHGRQQPRDNQPSPVESEKGKSARSGEPRTTDSIDDEEQPVGTTDADPRSNAPQKPFKTATQCIAKGDNACVIKALKDTASTEAELGLLIETFRAVGDTRNATKYMKRFLNKYPKSNRSNIYRKIVETTP